MDQLVSHVGVKECNLCQNVKIKKIESSNVSPGKCSRHMWKGHIGLAGTAKIVVKNPSKCRSGV